MKMPAHKFEPFTIVHLRANDDFSGCVTGYVIRANCAVQYLVTWADGDEKSHWEGELTTEKSFGNGGGGHDPDGS